MALNKNKTREREKRERRRTLNNKSSRLALQSLVKPSDWPSLRPPVDHWSVTTSRSLIGRSIRAPLLETRHQCLSTFCEWSEEEEKRRGDEWERWQRQSSGTWSPLELLHWQDATLEEGQREGAVSHSSTLSHTQQPSFSAKHPLKLTAFKKTGLPYF